MNTDVMFSSAASDWETPQDLFDQLHAEFGFTVDAAANASNTKCQYWYGPGSRDAEDALAIDWYSLNPIWCNPPYGREIGRWIEKGYEASLRGNTVVMLLPARTDTAWFHDYCTQGEIRFIRGRLKFGGAENAAPFPSMIVVFRPPGSQKPYEWVRCACDLPR